MPHKHDNSAASAKAIKKEAQARGVANEEHDHRIFTQAPVINDTPDAPNEPIKVTESIGTDSAIGEASAAGQADISTGIFVHSRGNPNEPSS